AHRRAVAAASPQPSVRPVFRWALAAASVAATVLIVATISIPSLLRSRQASTSVPPASVMQAPEGQPKTMSQSLPSASPGDKESDPSSTSAVGGRKKLEALAPQLLRFQQQGQQGQSAAAERSSGVLGGEYRARQERSLNSLLANKAFAGAAAAPTPPAALADRADRPQF